MLNILGTLDRPDRGTLTIRGSRVEGMSEESGDRPAPQHGDERRRYYRLTDRGRRVMVAEARRIEELASAARSAALESKA